MQVDGQAIFAQSPATTAQTAMKNIANKPVP
jgi:hypothetical protein